MNTFIHVVHVLFAGIWLGGLVFTTIVISPAFKRLAWSPAERVAVRSEVGRQYSKVARANLLALLLTALADWAVRGWSAVAWVEIALIVAVIVFSELHAQVFAPRLGRAARIGDETLRRRALRISVGISMLNLLLSIGVAVLPI